jgi:hypothetical protein
MLGAIANILVEGSAFFRWPPHHSRLLFPSSRSLSNGLTIRWEHTRSRVVSAAETTSTIRIFRFVGATPFFIRIVQILRSDNIPADLGAGEHVSRNSEEHPQQSPIVRLLTNPALRSPVRTPRFPIVLCHGLYGFDVSMRRCTYSDHVHHGQK